MNGVQLYLPQELEEIHKGSPSLTGFISIWQCISQASSGWSSYLSLSFTSYPIPLPGPSLTQMQSVGTNHSRRLMIPWTQHTLEGVSELEKDFPWNPFTPYSIMYSVSFGKVSVTPHIQEGRKRIEKGHISWIHSMEILITKWYCLNT